MPLMQSNQTSIHYTRSGEGPAILFIQGVGVGGGGWRPQVEHFSSSYSVASFDNRGFGRSAAFSGKLTIEAMAGDALALMDHLGWKSAHVVGHSMGGLIAQQLAVSQPSRVESLSLLCTFSQGSEAARLTIPVLLMGLRTRIGTRRMRRHALLRMILSKNFVRQADLDELAAAYAADMGRDLADSPAIIMKQLQAMSRHDLYGALSTLKDTPTLVVSASEDPIAKPEYGRRLAAAIPGAKYIEVPDASHAVTLEKPDETNRILSDFLDDIKARRR